METEETLQEKLITISRLMVHGRSRRADQAGPMADPSCGQGRILALLKLRDGISTKELAQALGMRVSSLNEQLAKMERAGVVERRTSDEDRRIMLVYLTEAGKAEEQIQFEDPRLFSGFSDEELEKMGAFLDRIIENLESELPEDVRDTFFHERDMRAAALSRMLGEEGFGRPDMRYFHDMRDIRGMRDFRPAMRPDPFGRGGIGRRGAGEERRRTEADARQGDERGE